MRKNKYPSPSRSLSKDIVRQVAGYRSLQARLCSVSINTAGYSLDVQCDTEVDGHLAPGSQMGFGLYGGFFRQVDMPSITMLE
ncbi:MAG: hypothetical protein ACU843_17595, partial [Gammaproteobacteria bacterium]